MEKSNKGVTLIALVVTIIVLLILAGVTIATLTGDNGIIQKAAEAKEKTDTSNKLEAVKLAVVSSMMEGYDLSVDLNKLKENLANAGIDFDANSLPASIDINGTSYIIDTNGDVIEGDAPEGITIPNGFVASQATGENNISTGLVIYEGTEPVTNSNVEIARKTRNQFVWVPVEDTNLTYSQDHTYDSKHQYHYSNASSNTNGDTIWTWKDPGANEASVENMVAFILEDMRQVGQI